MEDFGDVAGCFRCERLMLLLSLLLLLLIRGMAPRLMASAQPHLSIRKKRSVTRDQWRQSCMITCRPVDLSSSLQSSSTCFSFAAIYI